MGWCWVQGILECRCLQCRAGIEGLVLVIIQEDSIIEGEGGGGDINSNGSSLKNVIMMGRSRKERLKTEMLYDRKTHDVA